MRAETVVTENQTQSEAKERTLPPKGIWLTSAAHFTNDFYNGFLPPLLPMLVVKLDITLALAGTLVSILSIFSALLQPVTGILADRLRRNYMVVFAPLITGSFMCLIGIVNHYYMLVIILALSGIGTSLFHPQGAALAGRISGKRRGFSMSVFNMGGSFGVAVAPIIIVPFVTVWGLEASVFTVILSFVAMFLTLPLLNHSPNISTKRDSRIMVEMKGYWNVILLLYILVVIRSTMIITMNNFIPLYLTSKGNTLFMGASGSTVFQIFGTIGILTGGYFSDRMNPKKLLQISFLFVVPFALVFLHFPDIYGLPFAGLAAFFLFSSIPVNIILGQKMLPGKTSFISGIMMGFGWGMGGLMATPFGALADHVGLYHALLLLILLAIPGLILAKSLRLQSRRI